MEQTEIIWVNLSAFGKIDILFYCYFLFTEPKKIKMTEKFDENMMNIIKFAFRKHYTNGTGNEPFVDAERTDINPAEIDYSLLGYKNEEPFDITEDEFWHNDFKKCIQSVFYWKDEIWGQFFQHNTMDLTDTEIAFALNNETMRTDYTGRYHTWSWAPNEKNMSKFIYNFYHTKYEDRIREWAQDEFLFSPK